MEGPSGTFSRTIWGNGMSVGRQYYHSKKQSEETPLEYLYRLNVAAIGRRYGYDADRGMYVVNMWNISSERLKIAIWLKN